MGVTNIKFYRSFTYSPSPLPPPARGEGKLVVGQPQGNLFKKTCGGVCGILSFSLLKDSAHSGFRNVGVFNSRLSEQSCE